MKVSRITATSTTDLREAMEAYSAYNFFMAADVSDPEEERLREMRSAERGFKQETSQHLGRKNFTLVFDPLAEGDVFQMVQRTYYKPIDTLAKGQRITEINISSNVRTWLQTNGAASYRKVTRFIREWASRNGYYVLLGRKNKIVISDRPLEQHEWAQHFKQYAPLYRNEALATAYLSFGMIIGGNTIPRPKRIVNKVSDGVIAYLSKSEGAALGYYPSMWQAREKFPFAKGLILVGNDDRYPSWYNTDVLKLKRKLQDGTVIMEPISDTMVSDDIVMIANSDDIYDMRFSHQMGYLLKNDHKSKGGAWGIIDKLLENAIVKEVKDKKEAPQLKGYQIERVAVEELMPDYIRSLISMRLPKQYLGTVQQITEKASQVKSDGMTFKTSGRDVVDTILLAARPKVGKMAMFAALPKSLFPDMEIGWHKPIVPYGPKDPSGLSDHIGRVPFMAHGGGIQQVKWVGTSQWKAIICVVEDITPDEEEKEQAAKKAGKKYVRKDSPESAKCWKQIMAMGADSDGDRLVIFTLQGLKMLQTAGLTIVEEPEAFKAKNEYPGLNEWTVDMLIRFWETSTPRLGEVGKGDSITRDAIDAYKSGMFDWETYMRFALHGAGQVQVGVSAPKYFFTNPYHNLAPFTSKELKDEMEKREIGQGRKFFGLLWDKAREKAEAMISDYLPERMEVVSLKTGSNYHADNWIGGYTEFHEAIRHYSPDQGTDWPTVIRNNFFKQLTAHGITAADVAKGLKKEKALKVQKLVRKYILAYPHRINVWVWMLDERLTGLTKENVLEIIGLPFDPIEE